MNTRAVWQVVKSVAHPLLAFALYACVENASPSQMEAAASKDACDEALEYAQRAAQADSPVKEALERIANTKSRECAKKKTGSLDRNAASTAAPK